MVFNELNRLSGIPIHKNFQKVQKDRLSGVVYYIDVDDLLDRIELA